MNGFHFCIFFKFFRIIRSVTLILFFFINTAAASLTPTGPYEVKFPHPNRDPAHLFLPQTYEEKNQWPLIILLHGSSATAELEDLYLGLSFYVNSRGFILLLPEGTQDQDGNRFWNATEACCDAGEPKVDDEGYLLKLIDFVKQEYRVDARRIYLFGHSNGGFMAYRLACHHASSFAAIGSLEGATYFNQNDCKPSQPISILEIHAKDDSIVHFQGGHSYGARYPSANQTVRQWLRQNHCDLTQFLDHGYFDLISSIPGQDTRIQTWSKCAYDAEVAFWKIRPFPFHFAHAPVVNSDFVNQILSFFFSHRR